jgi:hypothetical protein
MGRDAYAETSKPTVAATFGRTISPNVSELWLVAHRRVYCRDLNVRIDGVGHNPTKSGHCAADI